MFLHEVMDQLMDQDAVGSDQVFTFSTLIFFVDEVNQSENERISFDLAE